VCNKKIYRNNSKSVEAVTCIDPICSESDESKTKFGYLCYGYHANVRCLATKTFVLLKMSLRLTDCACAHSLHMMTLNQMTDCRKGHNPLTRSEALANLIHGGPKNCTMSFVRRDLGKSFVKNRQIWYSS